MRFPVRARVAFFLLLAVHGVTFAETWFSIAGNPLDSAIDTVQAAPDTVVVFGNLRVMKIRTNRAAVRQGYDGLPFRSYLSTVQIDCESRDTRFRKLELFDEALWRGPSRMIDYADREMPKMVFQDMRPNPVARIVQAACEVGKVQSR